MKRKDYRIITALILGAAAWAAPLYGQTSAEANAGLAAEMEESSDLDGSLSSVFRSSERVLERASESGDDVVQSTRSEVAALEQSLQRLKSTWENEFRPDEGATREEIRAAVNRFRAEYRSQIAAAIDLRQRIAVELRSQLGKEANGEDFGAFVRSARQEINALRTELKAAWSERLDSLGSDASREEIEAAKAQFLEDNQDLIALQKELSVEIRHRARARSEASFSARAERGDARAKARAEARAEVRADLGGLGASEAREAARQEISEEFQDAQDTIRNRQREVIEEVREGQDGDRSVEELLD